MAQLHKSVATLRIFGDSLTPEEVSRVLGCEPTRSEYKGKIIRGPQTGRERIAKTGAWRLETTDREPEDLDSQISELLTKTTQDIKVWKSLSDKFEIDLFCGFFLSESNEGLSISPESLVALGKRGITLSLDIYGPDEKQTTA